MLFNFGVATHVERLDRRAGFSFHDYCLTAARPAQASSEPWTGS